MPKRSAGLLLYRVDPGPEVRVLLVHPGGPFWARKDDGAWSIPKGEHGPSEDAHGVALREFEEELGTPPPDGTDVELGEVRQPGGKHVTAWARQGTFDADGAASNTFTMEWPRGSGTQRTFPEVDRAAWFTVAEARTKVLRGQVPFLDRLTEALAATPPGPGEG